MYVRTLATIWEAMQGLIGMHYPMHALARTGRVHTVRPVRYRSWYVAALCIP